MLDLNEKRNINIRQLIIRKQVINKKKNFSGFFPSTRGPSGFLAAHIVQLVMVVCLMSLFICVYFFILINVR